MNKEEIMMKILTASADKLEKVVEILDGRTEAPATGDRRLYTLTQAASEMNVSRMTIWRMIDDGRLHVVETRAGRRRVPSAEITRLLGELNIMRKEVM